MGFPEFSPWHHLRRVGSRAILHLSVCPRYQKRLWFSRGIWPTPTIVEISQRTLDHFPLLLLPNPISPGTSRPRG